MKKGAFEIEAEVIANWQSVVDTLAEILDVPTALIMRLSGDTIEVLLASRSEGILIIPATRSISPVQACTAKPSSIQTTSCSYRMPFMTNNGKTLPISSSI